MMHWIRLRLAYAVPAIVALSACAGPVHVQKLTAPEALHPDSYAFADPSPNGSAIEVSARRIVADALATKGFIQSATPHYIVDLAVSERAGSVSIYTPDPAPLSGHTDLAPPHPFAGLCNDNAVRLALVFTNRLTGHTVSGVRSGQLRCAQGLAETLPKLADAALADALR